ncbi:hypothetical protein [Halalkalibacter krulwichiae]|uniref:Uncharacterized protein n=1 Tax=Halalkalibacter krulwichiae TaxID=199441 RepID=A0A1X9ML47_9BACI|nr:hypothetical protein [Halalkalibacter krulwichiae]ARK31482.1 hypothetical protein BkAM31D_17465 [Halalkalibacter krulwichiae]
MRRNDPPYHHNPYRYQPPPIYPAQQSQYMQQQQNIQQQQNAEQPPRRAIDPQAKITPNQIAVITALLTNALRVQSILIDKDKTIQVLLEGSLQVQKQSELDKLVDQVRDVPVGDFISSLLKDK